MPKQTTAFPAPSLGLLATEPLRAALEFCAARLVTSTRKIADGNPVIVYPGLAAGALSTATLRHALRDCGFTVYDWGFGVNRGPQGDFEAWLGELAAKVRETHAKHGQKVCLIGWSLGGIYARELAKLCPGSVQQVITLGTPFAAMGEGNHAGTIYRLLGGDTSQLTPQLEARLRECPPVPTTSIYSKSDGVVCWRGCVQAGGDNVEVHASHLGMGAHPQVLRAVLRRLKAAIAPRRSATSPAR